MDDSKNTRILVPVVVVLYDFQYTAKDKREISMKKGEKLYLIEKTNKDWWQVVRQSERRSFYVPAQYVEVISKEKLPLEHLELSSGKRYKEKVEYENLNVKHRDSIPSNKQFSDSSTRLDNEMVKSAQLNKQKPVPKTRTKVSLTKVSNESCGSGDLKVLPGETENDKKQDIFRYGDKKTQDLSLSLPKNSDELTHLLNEMDASFKIESESEKPNHLPKGRSMSKTKSKVSSTFSESEQSESGKNRMKSSYNLRVKPSKSFEIPQKSPRKFNKKETPISFKNDNRNLSRSLEKLAQEIKFQPKEVNPSNPAVPELSHHSSGDDSCRKFKNKPKELTNNNNNVDKKDKIQKVEEQNIQPQSKASVFTRIRRSLHHSSSFKSNNFKKLNKNDKKACELSLSWEGGLDKTSDLEKKIQPQMMSSGLQRSRTFMVAEKSPTVFRHASSIYQGRNRVDIAYHSQKPLERKNVLSTFKPITKIHESKPSVKPGKSPRLKRKFEDKCGDFDKNKIKDKKNDEDDGIVYENIGVWVTDCKTNIGEACSHSESEDNSDIKNCSTFTGAKEKLSRNRSSVDSNMTHSEGTELSESDENGSLELDLEKHSRIKEPLNKRRTSLMRNRRVSTAKSRTVTARQLPPTPTPDERSTKDLGNGWGVYAFDDKRNYYYNKITGEKSWKPPRRNLSCQDNRCVGSRESVCSDTSGSVIRSSTSSPSNDRILTNSLNRSNASLSSRSIGYDNTGYDIIKSSSGCNIREEGTQNRSLASSPATGQSQSSSYSVIKSSRDSLNRCSPIENIPSEDDIELHDHVYQEDAKEESKGELSEAVPEEMCKSRDGEGKENKLDDARPVMGVPVPPGWTEYYDESTNQFFYIHKETNQKEIRDQVEYYEDKNVDFYSDSSNVLKASTLSLYDNVNELDDDFFAEAEETCITRVKLETIEEEPPEKANSPSAKGLTWPLRKRLVSFDTLSVKDIFEHVLTEDSDFRFHVMDDNQQIIRFNWLNSKLTIIKRISNVNYVIAGGKDGTICKSKEGVEPVTNLLATCEGKLNEECWPLTSNIGRRKMCYKCSANDSNLCSEENLFRDILNKIDDDISELEERMTAFELKEKEEEFKVSLSKVHSWDNSEENRRHSLPPDFTPSSGSHMYVTNTLKPPLPPGKKKIKPMGRSKSLNRRNRSRRKQFVTLLDVLHAIDESNYKKRNEDTKEALVSPKPLPFPNEDYKSQDLLLLQRVTDSLKQRRKLSSERRAQFTLNSSNENEGVVKLMKDTEKLSSVQKEILKGLNDQLKKNSEGIRLREDVIIDWENNYDNLNEPVVLEGKSLYLQRYAGRGVRLGSDDAETKEEKSVTGNYEDLETGILSKVNEDDITAIEESEEAGDRTKCWEDCLASDKISLSSMSDYEDTLATYSDFESNFIEAIYLGESWCNEECREGKSVSEETEVSNLTVCADSCLDVSAMDNISVDEPSSRFLRKSASDPYVNFKEPLTRSKSLDFFLDSLTESRLRKSLPPSSESLESDVVYWLAIMRGIVFVEDNVLPDDNDREEWFTSFDPEGRLYFFDELSNESSWALPDITAEGEGSKHVLQRSATEGVVQKVSADEDGDKRRSRVSSTRSSKTQSMVIEPKLEFSSKDECKTLSMPRDLTKIYGEIIRSGMLNKTKICENGKKLRKNWTPAFVVLSNTKLLFFKDAKTFHSMKPANDCMCLNLQGAVIEKGDKISSKKNVYKINSVDHTEILIQTDRTSDAEEWYKDISAVIQYLPQESFDSSNSSLDPNSPSKIGRAKTVKAKIKDGGSMEDLSLNPEERQNKIKAKLKKFFNRRPTVDSLKKKGIWKDEPVFGCSLEQITRNRNPRVPVFVEKCIECIESKEENLKTDGLYRASGNLSQVQKIRLEVDQNNLNILKEEEDVHVLTGSLKLFFRELKDPLIPFKQLLPALTAINNPKRKEKIKEYRKIVGSLPGPNYDTLKFLLQHLLRVEEHNEFNRMNVNNLAIVFGPTLMWPEQESTNMALDFMQQNLVIECLLREFQEIFT